VRKDIVIFLQFSRCEKQYSLSLSNKKDPTANGNVHAHMCTNAHMYKLFFKSMTF